MQDFVSVMPKIGVYLAIDWLSNLTSNRRKYCPLDNRTLK